MTPFPSPVERTVASALLLLSTTKPASKESGFDGESTTLREEASERSSSLVSSGGSKLKAIMSDLWGESTLRNGREEEVESSKSKAKSKSSSSSSFSSYSASSAVTRNCSSPLEIKAQELGVIADVARCHEMKLKVVKKSRTKVSWISDDRKISASKKAPVKASSPSSQSECTEVSCLSSGSSAAVSSARSRLVINCAKRKIVHDRSPHGSGSAHMRHRAEAILEMLSRGCFAEVKIRRVLGDSPDTSKALRMLLKLEEVKRSGTGGRQDPYIYMIA